MTRRWRSFPSTGASKRAGGCSASSAASTLPTTLGPICSLEDRGLVADCTRPTGSPQPTSNGTSSTPTTCRSLLGSPSYLVERADAKGFPFAIEQEETSAVLPLPSDWEAYLASPEVEGTSRAPSQASGGWNESIPTRVQDRDPRNARRRFQIVRRRCIGGPKVTRGTSCVPRSRRSSGGWPTRSCRSDGSASTCSRSAARPIASTFGFQIERKFYLYNSAYEPDAARLSPGFLLVVRLVKESIENDLEIFDFLRGPERYKYQLGAQAVPLNNVQILNERAA